jgi:hypothetical protein
VARKDNDKAQESGVRIAIDIGSTVVKLARIDRNDQLVSQEFRPRDFEAGIARQVEALLTECGVALDCQDILVCSSANGGLRVGIICLSRCFSGAVLRNQALLAGANPMFVRDLDEEAGTAPYVDILLVAGGIDCEDAGPLLERLQRIRLDSYRYGSLLYAGNRFLATAFQARFPQAAVAANPMAEELGGRSPSVFEAVRRAYLDDLVYKEGVSELRGNLSKGIRPTPEVANRGFQRAVMERSSLPVSGACVLLDIGGATTDLHYTVEIIRDDSPARPSPGTSIARYVFTDLGIVASQESLLLQMRGHPRLYEFLEVVLGDDVREAFRLLREGEYVPPPEVLSYGCLFLALDRFARGHGPGLPTGDLNKVSQFLLSGGAAQTLEEEKVSRVIRLLVSPAAGEPVIIVDRRYQIWVDGITWTGLETIQGN